MKINLQNVIDEIEQADDTIHAFYSPQQEKIVYLFDYDPEMSTADPEDWTLISLPDRHDINDYHNMELFIETVQNRTTAEWLANAIHGRGAFRMFRATLERFGLTERWYDFLDRQHRILAIEWCEDHGIEYEASYAAEDEDNYLDDDDEDNSYGFHEDYTKDRSVPAKNIAEMPKETRIVPITSHNSANIVYMHADCRKELAALKKIRMDQDIETSQQEIDAALQNQEYVFGAVRDGKYVGYMILKPQDDMVLSDLYVRPEYRRRGIATALFERAEETAAAEEKNVSAVMKPYYEKMLQFLQKQGWNHLSEIRLVRDTADENAPAVSLAHSRLKY